MTQSTTIELISFEEKLQDSVNNCYMILIVFQINISLFIVESLVLPFLAKQQSALNYIFSRKSDSRDSVVLDGCGYVKSKVWLCSSISQLSHQLTFSSIEFLINQFFLSIDFLINQLFSHPSSF